MRKILVVEDEDAIREVVALNLRLAGYEVTEAASAEQALAVFSPSAGFDVAVLDIMLPDFDGLEVMRRVRGHRPNVPVLFLTAKDAVEDRVAGLTAGGDDYVTKPFDSTELLLRIEANIRRHKDTIDFARCRRIRSKASPSARTII